MPADVEIAKELATLIEAGPFSEEFSCNFFYDQYVEIERIKGIEVRVSVESDNRYRSARSSSFWHRDAVVSVIFLAKQRVNSYDAENEISSLLDLWDEMVDFIQVQTPQGRPALDVRAFDGVRFDKQELHTASILRAGVAISYKLI